MSKFTSRKQAFYIRATVCSETVEEVGKQSLIDIASGNHRYVGISYPVIRSHEKEKQQELRRRWAGGGGGLGIHAEKSHGLANLILSHGHDIVHISADVFEIDCPNALGAKTIGQGLRNLLCWS